MNTAKLKAAAPYQSRFSRLWERYDEASHCNAEHMRDILEVALDALETAERHMLKADRETLELIAALEAAQKRNAELEARTVKLPSINPQMFNDDVMFGYRKAQREAVEFCAAAGIKLEVGGVIMTAQLSREIAAIFRKATNSNIDEEGNLHCVLTPADCVAIHSARMLLAGMDSEPVAYIGKQMLESLCDEGGRTCGRVWRSDTDELSRESRIPLYTAPPALAVPEWTNQQCLEFLAVAFRHAEIKGDFELDDLRLGVKMANAMTPGKEG